VPRALPPDQKRVAEEAVRQGIVAAVVMEAAAREWAGLEGEEPFLEYLVRREVLPRPTLDALAAAVAGEGADPAAPVAPGDPSAARPSHPSEVIRGYRILERLGRGGMGSVYRAEQVGMNRVVALKILRRPLGSQEEHVERLRREARLVGSLDHPNIVRGLDVGQHGPYHYFAMEFVEGETLRETMKKRGTLPEAEALRILEQVVQALDHAHSRGIVHRDVKPGNIILAPDGTPKLTDYGLAKGPADFTLTQSGVTIGTPQFISPEQARDPAGADIQTDLYSLGATAYSMLAGIPPHSSDTLAGLLTKVLYEKPRTVRQVNPRVSAGASFLVEKLMAKEKRYRYRTPREVLRDLRALAAGKSIVPRDWSGDFEVHATRRKLRWAAAAVVVVAAVASAAIWALQVRAERQERLLREERARGALDALLQGPNPGTHRGWVQRLEDLEQFQRAAEHRGTQAAGIAEREREAAHARIANWRRAEQASERAARLEQAGDFVAAIATLDEERDALALLAGAARDAHAWLVAERGKAAERAFRAAEKASLDAVAEAAAVPGGDGAGVEGVLRVLEAARTRILARLWSDEEARPAADLRRLLEDVRQARAAVDDAHLSPGWREARDRAILEGRFRLAAEELARRVRAMEEDAQLQGALLRIPSPAAADLRGRATAEHRGLVSLNRAALALLETRVLALEAEGRVDEALAEVEEAESRSLPELAEVPRRIRDGIEARRDAALAAGDKAFLDFRDRFLRDLSLRAYEAARTGLDAAWEGARTPAGGGERLRKFLEGADFLLRATEGEAFLRVRRRIEEGGDLPLGLRFEEGERHTHLKVTSVRVQDAPSGPQVLFEVPGMGVQQGSLHRLSIELLLAYAGLKDEAGLTDPQALVRAALVIAEAMEEGRARVVRKDVEDAHATLRRIQARLPIAGPVVEALLGAAEAVVEREIKKVKDQDQLAREALDLAFRYLTEEPRDPVEAKRLLERLLSHDLSRTQYARDQRATAEELLRQSLSMIRDSKLQALYPSAAIEEQPGQAGGDAISSVLFDFEGPEPLRGFLPPLPGGARLFSAVVEASNGHAGAGRLRFVRGAAGQELRDNPLELECAFQTRSRPLRLTFTYRSEDPLFLQVSLGGVHLGILTDDGRRTSGRGVYAWLSEDWRNPDAKYPLVYRHDFLVRLLGGRDPAKEEIKEGAQRGLRYFQLEAGREYRIAVEWAQKRLRLVVNDQPIWLAELRQDAPESRPRIRLVTFTPCWIDDLRLEGVVDRQHLERLLRERR
jgi:tRNA A-37 threonylcarbamoyl transferase component Bud32